MYVRFGGEYMETCRGNPVRRWVLTLLLETMQEIRRPSDWNHTVAERSKRLREGT